MALIIVLTPAHTFPAGRPVTLAALRKAASPSVSISGAIIAGDIGAGAVIPSKVTPGAYWYAIDAGGNDAYVATYDPAVAGLADGLEVALKVNTRNTGPCTFNPNGLGAKPIRKHGGSRELDDYDLQAGRICILRYTYNPAAAGTDPAFTGYWELMSQRGLGAKDYIMVGASAYLAGEAGLVTQPKAGEQNYFLRGDSKWTDINAQIDARIGISLEMYKWQQFS